jgi:hypothetical protein
MYARALLVFGILATLGSVVLFYRGIDDWPLMTLWGLIIVAISVSSVAVAAILLCFNPRRWLKAVGICAVALFALGAYERLPELVSVWFLPGAAVLWPDPLEMLAVLTGVDVVSELARIASIAVGPVACVAVSRDLWHGRANVSCRGSKSGAEDSAW